MLFDEEPFTVTIRGVNSASGIPSTLETSPAGVTLCGAAVFCAAA